MAKNNGVELESFGFGFGFGKADLGEELLDIYDDSDISDSEKTDSEKASGRMSADAYMASVPMPSSVDPAIIDKIRAIKAQRMILGDLVQLLETQIYNMANPDLPPMLVLRSYSSTPTQHHPDVVWGSVLRAPEEIVTPFGEVIPAGMLCRRAIIMAGAWVPGSGTIATPDNKRKIVDPPFADVDFGAALIDPKVKEWYASKVGALDPMTKRKRTDAERAARLADLAEFHKGKTQPTSIVVPLGIMGSDVAAYTAAVKANGGKGVKSQHPAMIKAESISGKTPRDLAEAVDVLSISGLTGFIEAHNAPIAEAAEAARWIQNFVRSKLGGVSLAVPRSEPRGFSDLDAAETLAGDLEILGADLAERLRHTEAKAEAKAAETSADSDSDSESELSAEDLALLDC